MRKTLKSIPQPAPLNKLAYEKLRESIMAGHLKPGEIYNEMSLAEELGISRTPVREALVELSAQGLVTFLPRRGVQINAFTERDIEEVFELRKLVELGVIDKIADLIQYCDLDKLEKTIEDQRKQFRTITAWLSLQPTGCSTHCSANAPPTAVLLLLWRHPRHDSTYGN